MVIIFIIFMIRKSDLLRKYALLLVLGGALGNFFDRLIYKAVPDFIGFHLLLHDSHYIYRRAQLLRQVFWYYQS